MSGPESAIPESLSIEKAREAREPYRTAVLDFLSATAIPADLPTIVTNIAPSFGVDPDDTNNAALRSLQWRAQAGMVDLLYDRDVAAVPPLEDGNETSRRYVAVYREDPTTLSEDLGRIFRLEQKPFYILPETRLALGRLLVAGGYRQSSGYYGGPLARELTVREMIGVEDDTVRYEKDTVGRVSQQRDILLGPAYQVNDDGTEFLTFGVAVWEPREQSADSQA